MKKLLSVLLCVAMAAVSICSVAAAETDDSATGITLADAMELYQIKGTDVISDNYLKAYTYGVNIDSTSALIFYDEANSSSSGVKITAPTTGNSTTTYLPSTQGYTVYQSHQGSMSNYVDTVCLNSTGATYQRIRVNLSKFSSYFDTSGCHTKTLGGISHSYNFTNEGNGFSSSLVIISGGAVTFAAPDKYGMVEFYVSTDIGAETRFKTDFSLNTSTSSSDGGGVNGELISGLAMGDANKDGTVNVSDATSVQRYIAGTAEFDNLSLRNADVNKDGKYNILDATLIQKYCAGYKV